ncbi:MAG: LysE family translocator, partial [Pseudomonadota bacterium]
SLGLSILFETIPVLFTVMKFAGAAFLIWMGIGMLRQRLSGVAADLPTAGPSSFWRAFMVEALNPTTALFFLAFLPQFVSTEGAWPIAVQFLVLGTVVGAIFSISDLVYALAAGRLHTRLTTSTRLRHWAQRTGGAILIGLGLNLALSRST